MASVRRPGPPCSLHRRGADFVSTATGLFRLVFAGFVPGNPYTNISGHMGQLPVEQLVHLIEGGHHSEPNSKKQNHKDKSSASVVDALTIEEAAANQLTKKERRRKSKELKETSSAANVVTIGSQQTKTGGSQAAAVTTTSVASAVAAAQSPKMEFTAESKFVTSPGKRRSGEKIGAEANFRCSTEDGEEEFLSADEGVASVGEEPVRRFF
uniref:Uncharacterized protein n=1 Tax=Angiostrongylus cantonensis TaxID=6313 RepID=A0A0K0D838_ANGCA